MVTMNDWLNASPERQRLFAEERLIALAAEEIWEAMERAHHSQTDIAAALKKSKAHISQLLSGSRNMTLRTLADIAEAIGSTVDLRLREKSLQQHWQPLECARVMKLRPDAQLHYECQNDWKAQVEAEPRAA